MEHQDPTAEERRLSRRTIIKSTAGATAALWVAPAVTTFGSRAMAASVEPHCDRGTDFVCNGTIVMCGETRSGNAFCVCDQTTEGKDFCWENTFCAEECTDSSQCGPGRACFPDTCCGYATCLDACGTTANSADAQDSGRKKPAGR